MGEVIGPPPLDMTAKEEYNRLKLLGICVDCGHDALPFHVRCTTCLVKNAQARKKYYDNNRAKCLDYTHRHRKYNKEHGLCYTCSAPIDDDDNNGSIFCISHRNSATRNAGNNGKPFDFTLLM